MFVGSCVVELHGGGWGELCGGAVCGSCVWGAVSPVPPGGPHPLLLGRGVASSGRKKEPDLPNGAEVHKLSASQTPTGDHSFILFSVFIDARRNRTGNANRKSI